ncbi:hypothetical protein OS493_035410 [Desmophyllum pertusum]|uniref:Uncharacterized protein n=1 Tax=Desmophyllum pertusum TaxID=174260 RepID=A0A9W9ZIG0_9CNID|nr:hypothetical protein OS493_035410 [Desmophyllum pertusum]
MVLFMQNPVNTQTSICSCLVGLTLLSNGPLIAIQFQISDQGLLTTTLTTRRNLWVQGSLQPMMYNIYVTNKSGHDVAYVRLSSEKMQYADSYVQKIKEEILDKEGKEWSKEYISFLALGGFCLIPSGETRAFLVEKVAATMYVSVVCLSRVCIANFPFDPKMYGCLTILGRISNKTNIVASPYNPKPAWIPATSGDKVPSDTIEAGVGRLYKDEHLYFGRIASLNGGMPCAVIIRDNLCEAWLVEPEKDSITCGDFLKDTGFELIRANKGDVVPPNAIMAGVTATDGSLFVGRVGGSIPCHIATKNGKILHFVYGHGFVGGVKRVENGEVMVLTS